MPKYITVAEAQKLSGRSKQAIYDAIEDTRLRSKTVTLPHGGKLRLVLQSDVERGVWRRENNPE